MSKDVRLQTRTVTYFECECGRHQFTLDHIKEGQRWGPWYCDECGQGYGGVGHIAEKLDEFIQWGTSLLRLRPEQIGDELLLLVRSMNFSSHKDFERPDMTYLYEDHQCTSNILDNVLEVYVDRVPDPHGLFEWTGLRPGIPDMRIGPYVPEDWTAWKKNSKPVDEGQSGCVAVDALSPASVSKGETGE